MTNQISNIRTTINNIIQRINNSVPKPQLPPVKYSISRSQACPIVIESEKRIQQMLIEKYNSLRK